MADQKELPYRGERICQVDYTGQPFNKADAHGFTVKQAFVVLDDFDEHPLPLVQKWFWSPAEAIAAIELRDVITPMVKGKKWPTTVQYEFNLMVSYRRNFYHVYHALKAIRQACDQSRDFDDNPRAEIEKILHGLNCQIAREPKGMS